jgi:aryl-alcohol dehydrogenase-like predicted oxidoreductase
MPDELDYIPRVVRASVESSLARLGVDQVSLLQLHNSVTKQRGNEPTSLAVADVIGPGGVLDTFEQMREEGMTQRIGLTGIGDHDSLSALVDSGRFETLQTPFNLLNSTAAEQAPAGFSETNYGGIVNDCIARGMGVFAIRVLAGGALVGQPPSEHTRKTRFFPLDLFERDSKRATRIQERLPPGLNLAELAVRFVLAQDSISAAIIGLADVEQVLAAARLAEQPPLDATLLVELQSIVAALSREQST